MLIQEVETDLPPRQVLERAITFFELQFSPYGGFVSDRSDHHVVFRVEAAEVTIGTGARGGRTVVRGSSSRMHHEISQFLMTLAPPEEVRQNVAGPGSSGAG